MKRRLSGEKELSTDRWLFRPCLLLLLLCAPLADPHHHAMMKLMKYALKHGGYDSGKKLFLGMKGLLVPIPIPMKVSIPSIKLPSIMFDKGGGDDDKVKYVPVPVPAKGGGGKGWSGGGGGGWSGGGDWNGGGGGGGDDWNSGGGWATSHKDWTAPPASTRDKWKQGRHPSSSSGWKQQQQEDWKGEAEEGWKGGGKHPSWKGDDMEEEWKPGGDWGESGQRWKGDGWQDSTDIDWDDGGWQRHGNDDTDWDEGWR